jgi:hypothetical protein
MACRMHGRDEKLMQVSGQKIPRKKIVGNLGVNGRVLLKWILIRIGYCDGLL